MYILKRINGLIRLKIFHTLPLLSAQQRPQLAAGIPSAGGGPGFKEACILYNLDYIEANYNIALYDPYFAGLVDTDGSIVFNYAGNRIECNLEFKYNEYTSKLNFDNTILHSKPFIIKRAKSSKSAGPKDYISIAFKFQNVDNMLFIYDYFIRNLPPLVEGRELRLYCDMKFYSAQQAGRQAGRQAALAAGRNPARDYSLSGNPPQQALAALAGYEN